ncbi:MAG: tRNA (adenosine(37)-N6)-threonylcarbamoyltransferase complex ATPase subunit type 1 TsaE [Leptolyngbyaceae bacterium]|nr:tRNA (adenosine(37)-N6)-threonylcarbamoyltransferase complex ATPase subunit type 1 TsaE [Leptolyngbyaceae bacterium]
MVITLPDFQATHALGLALGQTLEAGSTLLLEGDLGSGKTTLVQGIGAGLGIQESIESPTFTLINEYVEGRLPLYHLDLYRLESAEVVDLHPELYWEGIEFPLGIMAIEWPDRLPHKPSRYLWVRLTDLGEQGRQATIIPIDGFTWKGDLEKLVRELLS